MSTLPRPFALLTHSWRFFTAHLNALLSIAFIMLAPSIVADAIRVLFPSPLNPVLGVVVGLLWLLAAVSGIWGTAALLLYIQRAATTTAPTIGEAFNAAVKYFWSYLWVAVLVFLLVLVAALPGLLVLLSSAGVALWNLRDLLNSGAGLTELNDVLQAGVPFAGIASGAILVIILTLWQSIRLTFASYAVVLSGQRGRAALQTSRELVRGRWWPVFGRLLFIGLCYMIVAAIFSPLGKVNVQFGALVSILIGVVFSPLATVYVYHLYTGAQTPSSHPAEQLVA